MPIRRHLPRWSDRESEFSECGGQPQRRLGFDSQFVVSAAQVLDERVSSDHHARRPVSLQPPHWSQSGFEPAVVAFDQVVLVLAGVLRGGGDQVLDHVRPGR